MNYLFICYCAHLSAQEERALNTNLRENQSLWQRKVEDLEARLKRVEEEKARETLDLKEQLR